MKQTSFTLKLASILTVTAMLLPLSACHGKMSPDAENVNALYNGYTGASAQYAEGGSIADTNAALNKSDVADVDMVLEEPAMEAEMMVAPMEPNIVPAPTPEFNTEEYSAILENTYKSTADYPLATFSADVDTASYTNIRRMIMDGDNVPADAVRIEEIINYFDYGYEAPAADAEHPFAVHTEYTSCPWNPESKLLFIGLQAKEIETDALPASNLVFLIDVSGSMYSDDKLPLVQKAFSLLTENLTEQDRISIVTYAGYESVVLEGASGDEKIKITDAINALSAGGSTHGSAGIKLAYEIAEKYFIDGGNNRVILATDGDLNVGITSEGELRELVEDKRESGVFLSVLGFGSGNIKDNKMETLADYGNGNYSYIDSIFEAKRVLVEEMGATLFTVAKDVKLQIEFNPEYVKGYRLIGYENRALATEDFADDTKDAGEIGAGHSVTAIFEIITPDSAIEIPATELKYQSGAVPTGSDELMTVSLRYKDPDADTSVLIEHPVLAADYCEEMSPAAAFASAAAQFGLLLRDSAYKGDSTFASLYERTAAIEGVTDDPYKTEFLYLVSKCQ